ncbi:MAG: hypothetical protein WAL68_07210, partial [Candidatus Binatus sp.]
MDRSPTAGLIAAIGIGLAPAAIFLIVLAATGAASGAWVAVVIVLGLALGAIPATAIGRTLSRRAER